MLSVRFHQCCIGQASALIHDWEWGFLKKKMFFSECNFPEYKARLTGMLISKYITRPTLDTTFQDIHPTPFLSPPHSHGSPFFLNTFFGHINIPLAADMLKQISDLTVVAAS